MLKIAVQMDPIASINPQGDSTFAMMLEAQARGHGIDYYTAGSLGLRDNQLSASVQPIEVFDKPKGEHFRLGDAARKNLADYDVVLMRQDPPFDMNYITITHLLERIHPSTYVVNPPFTVRNAPEKLRDTPQKGYDDSKALIGRWHKHGRSLYAITPRFAGTSTPEQLDAAGTLWREHPDVLVHSHIAENKREVEWTAELFPAP